MTTGTNSDIRAALRYHEVTKHSEARLRAGPHALDWPNQPLPLKIYRGLEVTTLPADPALLEGTTPPALQAIGVAPDEPDDARPLPPDLATLTRLLYLTAGITKRKRLAAGGEMYFRAYSNTGALYHVDVYLVTGGLPDLEAGVYHFAPEAFALNRLRAGDHRARLVEATGGHPAIAAAPLTLISASTYWRNAWKYRDRAYRHCFWDGGTMHANLLAAGDAEGLRPEVVLGFADPPVETLLALDRQREGALTLVPLGAPAKPTDAGPDELLANEVALPQPPDLEPLSPDIQPLSRSEVDYPLIRETQAASTLRSGEEAAAWRAARMEELEPAFPPSALLPLPAMNPDRWPHASLARVIRRRGSTRAFDRKASIELETLGIILERATRGVRADFLHPRATLLQLYLLVNAVDGLAPGAYRYDHAGQRLERIWEGECRTLAGRLALGQPLAADAAVNVYSLCDLDRVLGILGNRGYRAAQLEGGITGGRLYLAAYGLGIGATGLTFFDDEVVEAFSPQASGQSVMFLTALGRADRAALGLTS